MSDLAFTLDAPAPADTLPADVAALHARLDRLTAMVESLDRRREEVDELVTDLMPALNGLVLQATRRMDALEQSGALAVLRAGADALRTAADGVEPGQVRALGDAAPHGLRALRAAMEPEVAAVAEQAVAGIRAARTGRPPSLRSLWRGMREPHVRRGLGAALAVLRALGTGGGAAPAPAPPAPRPASRPPSTRAATVRSPAPACQTAGPAAPAPAATVQIAGQAVRVDAEGFLVDRDAWSPELAAGLAAQAGIPALTERHWKVIDFCRADAADTGAAPGLRRITQALGMPPAELYALFPRGPGILAARVAGLAKPRSCV